jgi:crotonobetainyl-CoA:carnitine CoA-transferase CaiB-like acyl-CoA transferase
VTVLGPVARVEPVVPAGGAAAGPTAQRGAAGDGSANGTRRLLTGVRVLDLSAYLAGPITPHILAELGADVVKVEPTTGDVHRSMEPMFAAGQRGKRSLALDLKAPDAGEVLERLFRWTDVVHHNARLGLAERLGYDEATVRAANPEVIYSHATGFGTHGPRAPLPANDYLMQALSGVETVVGGEAPTFLVWGAMDVAGGWLTACAVLAGLCARRRTGAGQSVRTSLLGAAMTLTSGSFVAGDAVVEGPIADRQQSGFGAAYRIYQGRDAAWFALAVPDADTWERLRRVVAIEGLPATPPALRTVRGERQPEEEMLEAAFATRDAGEWVAALRAAGVPVEPVAEEDRAGFVSRIVDDPVSRQLGRVVDFDWGPRGRLVQPGFPLGLGPAARPAAPLAIPGLGEHTDDVLSAVGYDDEARSALAATGTVTASV